MKSSERRAVEKHLEDTLAESILEEEIENSDNKLLVAKLKDGEVYFDSVPDKTQDQAKEPASKNEEKKQFVYIYEL